MQIAESTFLITGGASGLGAATAEHLVGLGARVALIDRDSDAANALVQQLGSAAISFGGDVIDPEQVQSAIARTRSHFGPLVGLINCAGIATPGRVLDRENNPLDLARFASVIAVNLTGSFNVIRLAAAEMATNSPDDHGQRGVIINTASIAAFDGQIGQAAYAASKSGIVGMTLPLARELAVHGIRVVAIAPGVMDTPMLAQLPQHARQALSNQVPFPSRLGRPGEFASLVEAIVGNPYLNGTTIRLDAGLRMGPG